MLIPREGRQAPVKDAIITTQAEDTITIRAQPVEAWQTDKANEFTIKVVLSVSDNAKDLKSTLIKPPENA